jgi:hypothetical protein
MADGAGGTVELQVPFYSWRSIVGCSLVEDKFQTPPAMAYMCLTGKKGAAHSVIIIVIFHMCK